MAIENIKQLRTVNGAHQAQKLLNEGWHILAVCVMQDGSSQYAEYHLGHDKPASVTEAQPDLEAVRKAVIAAQGKVLRPTES